MSSRSTDMLPKVLAMVAQIAIVLPLNYSHNN